ncbi:PREDICTED: kinectin isoform X1 [Polistes canadensis]|uniref:kinectin isoform X1 n=2 Tax=Polistes canadensis TaxID=91411 RepID=UPI000718C244|nr:PREDICTED: kinectin isoform X1 [Polistes canadensis]XP_014601422.1 PREDICTED: kinectin isoform X1 [Polistes canadensis]XP_014601423.1 PREDICTED: kinectin isoform X1 [Polistes canadensis]
MGAANTSNILPSSSASSIPLRARNTENPIEVNFAEDNILHCVDGANEDSLRSTGYNVTGEPRAQMAYVTRTTDWKAVGEASNSSLRLQHRENMELSQIILQLAKANQQLANAHTTALAQLEGLYLELQREKNSQKLISNNSELTSSNILSRKKLTSQETKGEPEEENDSRIKLERRIDRLESVVSERSNVFRNQQKNIFQDRVPRVEVDKSNESHSSEQFSRINRYYREHSTNSQEGEMTVRNNEIRGVPCNTNSDKIFEKKTRSYEKHDQGHAERLTDDEMIQLFEELRALKADKVEYQNTNERLNANIAEQKKYTEKLCKDYEILREQCEHLECSLKERRNQHEKLLKDFDLSKNEMENMVKEITSFQSEKDTAEARISSLEGELKRVITENEQIKDMENEKVGNLKAQLVEEISDKKKHMKTLEEALNEIQRLKEAMKTDMKNTEETIAKDDIDSTQSNEISEDSTTDRTIGMDLFKKELILKREARQRAIAAVSSEMERLRQELEAEKEAHSETSRVLDLLRSTQSSHQNDNTVICDNRSNKRSKSIDEDSDDNEILLRRIEVQRLSSILKVSDELRNNIRFQIEKVDDLRYQLESEPEQHRYIIRCLTDVTNKTRDTLNTREHRANELKDYLARNLARLNDRTFLDTDDVSAECERQLESINSLKSLYNERLRVITELKDTAIKELIDVKENLKHSSKEREGLEEDLRKAEEKIDAQDTEISNLESQLGLTKADCRDLQNQMSLINSLFTQMLLGASSADMDLDRLSQLLQENRDLITDIARDNCTEAAALPKLLLDLVEQVDGNKGLQKRNEDDQQHEEIAHNLPKVWRVLLELLSCHAAASQNASATSSSDSNSCYKSVDTPSGPKLVISVSKTYIHLKELILEKKHLEKEMNRMKQLNTHLESKLGEQEKRLSDVTAELSKTWNIVGRMQAQHQQLHTHEKILRYELQQKRKMLQELKLELEYCREKWESARQKNTNTELEWRSLRREFAARKMLSVHDSVNNSAESGFSDERGDDTDEEDETVEDRVRMGLTRRTRKESPKTSTMSTVELEQPVDIGLPEASSSIALTTQVPVAEKETEFDEIKIVDTTSSVEPTNTQESDLVSEVLQQPLDPLDQALTTVIRNLIRIDDDTESSSDEFNSRENISLPFMRFVDNVRSENNHQDNNNDPSIRTDCPSNNETKENRDIQSCCSTSDSNILEICNNIKADEEISSTSNSKLGLEDISNTQENSYSIEESIIIENISNDNTRLNASSSTPIFSIGPFPVARNNSPNQLFTPALKNDSNEINSTTDNSSITNINEDESLKSVDNSNETDNNSMMNFNSKDSENVLKESKPELDLANTPERVLIARADRLKRLEEQAQWLMNKMNATSRRGSALSTRLEVLHETYGEPSAPVPDVIQNRHLRSSSLSSLSQATTSSNTTDNVQTSSEDKNIDTSADDKTST